MVVVVADTVAAVCKMRTVAVALLTPRNARSLCSTLLFSVCAVMQACSHAGVHGDGAYRAICTTVAAAQQLVPVISGQLAHPIRPAAGRHHAATIPWPPPCPHHAPRSD